MLTGMMVELLETEAMSLLLRSRKSLQKVQSRNLPYWNKGKTHFVKVCTFLIDQMYFRDSNGNDNKNLALLFS